jgi:hypothetical protein
MSKKPFFGELRLKILIELSMLKVKFRLRIDGHSYGGMSWVVIARKNVPQNGHVMRKLNIILLQQRTDVMK